MRESGIERSQYLGTTWYTPTKGRGVYRPYQRYKMLSPCVYRNFLLLRIFFIIQLFAPVRLILYQGVPAVLSGTKLLFSVCTERRCCVPIKNTYGMVCLYANFGITTDAVTRWRVSSLAVTSGLSTRRAPYNLKLA